MRFDELWEIILPALGGAFGLAAGAMIPACLVTLIYRSQPLGGGSFAPLGDWARDVLLSVLP